MTNYVYIIKNYEPRHRLVNINVEHAIPFLVIRASISLLFTDPNLQR